MQGHTFSSFYIYRSLLINKPRINEVFVPDIYIIPDILWKSEKRFEVSAFEGSLFSGLISGSCYILSLATFGGLLYRFRGVFTFGTLRKTFHGVYILSITLSTGILNYNIID